jgi:hypothetical protein
MRNLALPVLLAGAAAISGCATVPPEPIPVANTNACGTGYVDVNSDGMISGTEWNTWRSGAYARWDVDSDGRIDRGEFERCWMAGGFYPDPHYNPAHWTHYWGAFDANADGYLSADEYWSASAWARIDANANGVIDSAEWNWWDM